MISSIACGSRFIYEDDVGLISAFVPCKENRSISGRFASLSHASADVDTPGSMNILFSELFIKFGGPGVVLEVFQTI